MDAKTFDQIVDGQLGYILDTLKSKATEYAFGGDRLSNFKRAAAMLKSTPEAALMGMQAKHLTSIFDMVDELVPSPYTYDKKKFSQSQWDEKIGDAINYFILLKGLVYERYGWKTFYQESDGNSLRAIDEVIGSRGTPQTASQWRDNTSCERENCVPGEVGPLFPQPVSCRCVPRFVSQPEDRRGDNEKQAPLGDRLQRTSRGNSSLRYSQGVSRPEPSDAA